jgi:HSP20 family molecular chaperone IbpA
MADDDVRIVKVIRHDLGRLFQDLGQLVHPSYHLNDELLWQPYADVYETDTEFVIKVELAGVQKADIAITVTDGVLSVRGNRHDVSESDEKRWYHKMEINQGQFEKHIQLPEGITAGKITSRFSNGILDIRLPKSAKETVDVPIE